MIRLNDTDYTSSLIREHRKKIINLRDVALQSNHFNVAVLLSITVGLLEELARREELEE